MREIVKADVSRIDEIVRNVLHCSEYELLGRMGGMTNHTYRVRLKGMGDYVVRIPGEGTASMISRKNERISMMLACELGIDAKLVFFGEDGTKVAEYISNAQTLNSDAMKDEQIIRSVAGILKRLHTCGADTQVPFDVFDMADTYESVIRENAVAMYPDYADVKARIMEIKKEIDRHGNVKRVPCHNDPLGENWVQSGGRLYLIDWEYAGMNDAMWDLADVSIESAYDAQQDAALLNAYLDHEPSLMERKRFMANKMYLDYLWTLWGKARVPFDGEDMEEYALERYIRLKKNMRSIEVW